MNIYSTAADVRNDKPHHLPLPPIELTPAGRVIWLRTHRAASTCNLLASLAGLGQNIADGDDSKVLTRMEG